METYSDLTIKQTKLPIYLEELLQSDEHVTIVYHKKDSNNTDLIENISTSLIGSPLKTNLNVPLAPYLCGEWSLEKTTYTPIKLDYARSFINDYVKNGNKQQGDDRSAAVYCICDGTDTKNVVLLGCQMCNGLMTRMTISSLGSVSESCRNDLENMVNKHISNVGVLSLKMDCLINCKYELYGYRLHDLNTTEIENCGSVTVESSWSACQSNVPEYGATSKMLLQVIVGHENSILYEFFEQLIFLSHCLNTLSNGINNLDEAIISHNPVSKNTICNTILEAIHDVSTLKLLNNPKGIHETMESVKEITLTDRLWNILKCCTKVSDLRECLVFLFEKVCQEATKVQILIDDTNNEIGKIISNIRSEQMNVPYLSSKQCLELLIELGMQKLKTIYFLLLRSCDCTLAQKLTCEWKKTGSFLNEVRRGMFSAIDLDKCFTQLKLLYHVHVLLEFFLIVQDKCCLSQDVSSTVINHAHDYMFKSDLLLEPYVVFKKKLIDLMVPLKYSDVQLLKDYTPSKWIMKMNTSENLSIVQTTFYYSKRLIFPDSMQKYTEENETYDFESSDKYFLAIIESYSDQIF